jgi:hypothetical protein
MSQFVAGGGPGQVPVPVSLNAWVQSGECKELLLQVKAHTSVDGIVVRKAQRGRMRFVDLLVCFPGPFVPVCWVPRKWAQSPPHGLNERGSACSRPRVASINSVPPLPTPHPLLLS